MKTHIELIQTQFIILRRRIVHHRMHCHKWLEGKSCYDCHKNKLTKIENLIKEMVQE